MVATFLNRPRNPSRLQPTHIALAQKDALDVTLAEQ